MGIGKELKRLREEVPISAAKIAKQIGVKAERWRKWEELDQKPRTEDTQIIEKFFNLTLDEIVKLKSIKKFIIVPHGTNLNNTAHFGSPLPLGNLVVTLGDYVDLLKKQADIYQKIAETNLGTILKNQEIGGGIVQEILERDVLKEAKGNPKKAEEILEAIRLKIAKTSGIALIKYIPDGEGIAHK